MTVSGLTIARALYAFGNDRQAVAKTSLSIVLKRRPFGAVRRYIDLLSQHQQLCFKSSPRSEQIGDDSGNEAA